MDCALRRSGGCIGMCILVEQELAVVASRTMVVKGVGDAANHEERRFGRS